VNKDKRRVHHQARAWKEEDSTICKPNYATYDIKNQNNEPRKDKGAPRKLKILDTRFEIVKI
jgi:hypothetical protein